MYVALLMGINGEKTTSLEPNKRSDMVKNDQDWSEMIRTGLDWSGMIRIGQE